MLRFPIETMPKETLLFPFSFFALLFVLASTSFLSVEAYSHRHAPPAGQLILKHHRRLLAQTEHGEISAASVMDGTKGHYHLQFITMEPNSLFLPVLLHADMVFFVHTGSGTLSWTDDDDIKNVEIRKGDIYRLHQGSVFYLQSSLMAKREKLRIYAIFTNTEDGIYEPFTGAYSSIADLVLGFDSKVLQATFKVPEDVIEEIVGGSKAPAIIHARQKEKMLGEWQDRLLKTFLGSNRGGFFRSINSKHKKKVYNVFEEDPDFDNCNGWSLTVDRKDLHLLKHSNIGVFIVNLTKGSMMVPHWNPRASEIAIVLHGQGMVRVVCSSTANESECRNMRYRVQEGDLFAVPRFHPMAQMSFNNDSFVFMGFSTSTKRNHPQFLGGKKSALETVDKKILASSFNVSDTTIDHLLKPQKEYVILDCTSCAEQEERLMEDEIERERREEEEARKKEEEARKRREEEEARKKEEEAQKRREEKEARKKEEKEEARKKREEEEEEEAKKKQEEEEEIRREEEEARKKQEEEEKAKREKEETRKKKEEEETKEREEEGAEKKKRKEEKRRREEETRKEQEEARIQEEQQQRKTREKEEEERRQHIEEKDQDKAGDPSKEQKDTKRHRRAYQEGKNKGRGQRINKEWEI